MKKFIYSLLALAITAMTFTSCEDVPMPYSEPTNGGGTTTTYTGQGTVDDPYTVADANNYIKAGVNLDSIVYVKGKISSVDSVSLNYGNAYYKISDDGTSTGQLIVYRGYAFGNQKFKAANEIKVGDNVVLVGKIGAFKGTYEFMQGNYINTLNGKTYTPTTADDNAIDKPYNVAKAIQVIAAGAPTAPVYVKGIISVAPSFNGSYGSLTYYISDDGTTTNQMQVYSGLGIGGAKFTSASDLKLGQTVEVYGVIKDYSGKPEIDKSSTLISVTGDGTSTGGETGGSAVPVSINNTTVTMANSAATESTETATVDLNTLGYADKAVVSTVSLTDGTTIVFDKNGETNAPVFNVSTKGVRVYKNNTITVNGKKAIAKIVFTCDSYSGTDYVGNTTATVKFSGNNATYTNVFTGSTGGGVQLRVQTITITYAK
ncbi:single stranded DNA-binding domain-containing protein [Segatella paludivivens]|uniref:hypothetical protein n=1 Tax=Segatella paludivivens TaxID=185294 RepID=UPI00035EEA06|nr:hypothetical protein [Segatella paludivivens]